MTAPAAATTGREVVVVAVMLDWCDLPEMAALEAAAVDTIVLAPGCAANQGLRRDPDAGGPGTAIVVDAAVLDRLATRAREQAAELARLRASQERIARVERAKGVLMARHGIGDQKAAEMLRRHARNSHVRIIEVADAVLTSFTLFVPSDPKTGTTVNGA